MPEYLIIILEREKYSTDNTPMLIPKIELDNDANKGNQLINKHKYQRRYDKQDNDFGQRKNKRLRY